MSIPKYTVKQLSIKSDKVTIPHITHRVRIKNGEFYVLTQEDIYQDRGQIMANLAFKFYGDPTLWTIIQDNNPPMLDSHLYEGIKLFIPDLNG